MADQNHSPKQKEFGHYTPSGGHAYNDPSLGPLEFLLAVVRDTTLPITVRVKAAEGAAPYFAPRPGESRHYPCVGHHLEYIIGDNHRLHHALRQSQEPRTPDPNSFTEGSPDGDYGNSQSFSSSRSNSHHPQSEPMAPVDLTTTSYPQSLPDYSHPPTPAEIDEIRAAIHALRPDLAHLPVPELHLCQCGHWICGPCPLGERCRERSKLN